MDGSNDEPLFTPNDPGPTLAGADLGIPATVLVAQARGTILFVVTLVSLGGLRWWWGKIADDRLAAMIAQAHARGEPILPEDFNPARSRIARMPR